MLEMERTAARADQKDHPPMPLARLAEILRRAEALDPRAYLAASLARVTNDLVRPLHAHATEALALAKALSEGENEDSELSGTCFAVQLEVGHGLRLLGREQDRASTLVACDIARQALLRSVSAVLGSASATGGPEFAALGRGAALVRGLYQRLRGVVGAVDGRSGRRALQAVEAALRESQTRPGFAAVRLSDRFVLENVHLRLVELARRPETDDAAIAELVSDAQAAIALLDGINRRPELVAYDRHIVATCRTQLAANAASRALLVQARELLKGRDGALDLAFAEANRHLARPPDVDAHLDAELARVESELAFAGGGF
jgi:hypothetical protein